MGRVSDKERMSRYNNLDLSESEKQELLKYDKMVEAGEKTEFDLTPEQEKVARMYTRTGERKTVYKFTPRKRKPNATKGALIQELTDFLERISQFEVQEVTILNKERQIGFKIGNESYELTLVQKRKKGS